VNPSSSFPPDFLWGAATAAYQVEGSPLADGAGPSIWHRFSHTAGRVLGGDTGDVACNQYRRYEEDIALMSDLGLRAYRFSLSWSRILPQGTGSINSRGLDHYERLVDALLGRDIEPMITLYHWDLPAALDDRGGWVNRDSASWFAEYAAAAFRRLEDRVRLWVTLNEPWVIMDGGYLAGGLAPGHRDLYEAPIVAHNLLRAHAAAVQAYRADGQGSIGIVVNLEPKHPASDRPADVEAAARAHAYMNRFFLDPIFRGAYPNELAHIFGEAWPDFSAEELERLREPIDFVGVNYYTRGVIRADPEALPLRATRVRQPHSTYTAMDWEVYPAGLSETLRWLSERYGGPPLYVTENGAAFDDPSRAETEPVDDPPRVDYLSRHLVTALEAIEGGVDLRGYFVWSLLDNFEWSFGYSKRFGIIHVDFETQKRTLKSSAHLYAQVIASNGSSLVGSPNDVAGT
jgi:beta-glucosidase